MKQIRKIIEKEKRRQEIEDRIAAYSNVFEISKIDVERAFKKNKIREAAIKNLITHTIIAIIGIAMIYGGVCSGALFSLKISDALSSVLSAFSFFMCGCVFFAFEAICDLLPKSDL